MTANRRWPSGLWRVGILLLLVGPAQMSWSVAAAEEGNEPGLATVAPAAGEPAETPATPEPTGPRVRQIEIKGLKQIPEHNIRDVIKTREGDVFSYETLLEDVNAILNLGYFVPPEMDPEGVQAIPE